MDERKIRQYRHTVIALGWIRGEIEKGEKNGEQMQRLRKREAEYQKTKADMEEWINKIEDPITHAIFCMKLEGKTHKEIGAQLGYSRSRITQIIEKNLGKPKD